MKIVLKVILMIVLLLSAFTFCKAKTVNIDSVFTYSQYYNTDSSNVYLVAKVSISSTPCAVTDFGILSYNGNGLTFRACYYEGLDATFCPRTDTFYLGVLPNRAMNIQAIFNATGETTCSFTTEYYANDTAYILYEVTGIEKLSKPSNWITLYPNPSSEKNYITFTVQEQNEVEIVLFNSTGAKVSDVYRGNSSIGYNQITNDVSNLSKGYYTYRVRLGDKIENVPFIKL